MYLHKASTQQSPYQPSRARGLSKKVSRYHSFGMDYSRTILSLYLGFFPCSITARTVARRTFLFIRDQSITSAIATVFWACWFSFAKIADATHPSFVWERGFSFILSRHSELSIAPASKWCQKKKSVGGHRILIWSLLILLSCSVALRTGIWSSATAAKNTEDVSSRAVSTVWAFVGEAIPVTSYARERRGVH